MSPAARARVATRHLTIRRRADRPVHPNTGEGTILGVARAKQRTRHHSPSPTLASHPAPHRLQHRRWDSRTGRQRRQRDMNRHLGIGPKMCMQRKHPVPAIMRDDGRHDVAPSRSGEVLRDPDPQRGRTDGLALVEVR